MEQYDVDESGLLDFGEFLTMFWCAVLAPSRGVTEHATDSIRNILIYLLVDTEVITPLPSKYRNYLNRATQ